MLAPLARYIGVGRAPSGANLPRGGRRAMPGPLIRDSLRRMKKRCLALAACAAITLGCGVVPAPGLAGAGPSSGAGGAMEPPPGGRLGGDVVPTAYELEMDVDPDRPRYSGRVTIDIRVVEPVSHIWLHAEELDIRGATLRTEAGDAMDLGAPRRAGGLLGFALGHTMEPQAASLEIAFGGAFGTHVGAFRQSVDGTSYVFTDFEPVDARRAFPCFDEPRFKTPWTLSLVVPAHVQALSNMPEESTEPESGAKKRVRFGTTPPLPTYLVAFAAGPFDIVTPAATAAAESPVPVRVIAPRGKAAWGAYAASIAPGLLRRVAEYVATPMPFPKIDLIAVPVFNGAMENPGLITVASHILLSDPDRPSILQRRFLALVCAHEFAHLWFGDLVTPADWNDLWLNEGFSTWLADKVLARWRPERMAHVDQVVARHEAMGLDAHRDARAVRQVGTSREDIEGVFDGLTYKKAGAVLAMFEAWLSEGTFRRATRDYVTRHAERSVTTASFVSALSAAAERDVGAALTAFLDRPGVPLVRAELRCDRARPRLHLSQERYILLADRGTAAPSASSNWQIPVCVRYDAGPSGTASTCTLLDRPRREIELDAPRCPEWLVPNADAAGYYHYSMSGAQLAALARAPLTEREATDLIYNLRALLYAGEADMSQVAAVFPAVGTSSRHAVEAGVAMLREVADHLVPARGRAKLRAFVSAVYGGRARALGFAGKPGESEEDALLRATLLGFVGEYGADPWIRSTASRLADTWLRTGRGIERGMITTTLSLAAQGGDSELYDRIEAALRDAVSRGDTDRQQILFTALAAFTDSDHVARSLALVTDPALGMQRHLLLRGLLSDVASGELALTFLEERARALRSSRRDAVLLLAPLFGPGLCSEERLERVRALAEQVDTSTAMIRKRLDEVARDTRACAHFRAEHAAGAAALFR